jgi:hypothetical protein
VLKVKADGQKEVTVVGSKEGNMMLKNRRY